jgi:hypothetical protein
MMKRLSFLVLTFLLVVVPLQAQQIVFPYISTDATPLQATVAATSTTTATLFAAGAAGVRNYLTQITCINPSTTAGLILRVLDGGNTAANNPTLVWNVPCGASGADGTLYFNPPLKLTAATALYVGIGTTAQTTNYLISATGFKAR